MMLTISDAIAVKIINKNAVIAGIGNELRLYGDAKKNHTLPYKLSGKIHGIELGDESNADKLLVFGEKEFMILERASEKLFNLLFRGYLTDWISSASFLLNENQFILLTAHSILLNLELDHNTKKCQIINKSSCSEKSTLYCSLMHGKMWKDVVVFGGNAFGELLIWQPTSPKAPLLKRLPSHNGVIFSIDYNPLENLLTTTSDDRSIKFWKVEQPVCYDWANTNLTPLASGYGHIARVFCGRIIEFSNKIYAITVGEDSYICVWRINGTLIFKCRHQFGATIWNCDYDEETKTVYTVGSTGNILAYCLRNVLIEDANQQKNSAVIMPKLNFEDSTQEYNAKIKLLKQNILVSVTNKNRMIYTNVKNKNETAWHVIDNYIGFKCTILEVFENTVAVCGYKRLTLYKFKENNCNFEKFYDHEILQGVIRAFIFLAGNKFLICDEGGNCVLLNTSVLNEKFECSHTHTIQLPKCKEPCLTTALLIDNEFLVISNRQGNILLFELLKSTNQFTQTDVLKHLHGNLGSTLFMVVTNTTEVALFKSAGHDGTLKLLRVDKMKSKLSVVSREVFPIAWVEALKKIDNTELFLGFNDNHFIVWTYFHDYLIQLPCGGGHRCWDFRICKNSHGIDCLLLVFIKNKQVLLHQFELFNKPGADIKIPLRNMWHVKPCNVIEFIDKDSDIITVSAGDDNLIKISTITKHGKEIKQMAEIQAHISNIRALKIVRVDIDNYLIVSGGGRAQLCVTKLNLETFLVEEILSLTLKSHRKSISNIQSDTKMFNFDPETRIMSLDVLSLNCDGYHVFIGCSDGYVRKYHLNSEWKATLITQVYYGKCILIVQLINETYLLVGATDGIIRFSNLSLTQIYLNLQQHASGINAFDVHLNEKIGELILLTGGDDQDVVLTRLSYNFSFEQPLRIIEKVRFDSLHTAQVTATQLSPCGKYSYSSGVDQLVFKFDLVKKQIVDKFSTCIADVKGLKLCADNLVLIYGCGIQITEL